MIQPIIPKRITAIKFGFLSPTEIRKMSSTKIITADTYDEDGYPLEMGLMDPRLGVIEPGLRCKSCDRKADQCTGHFGHIDLAVPIIHVGYAKVIKDLLRLTCRKCGRILFPESLIQRYKRVRPLYKEPDEDEWTALDIRALLADLYKEPYTTIECPHCGELQRRITLDKPTNFREELHKLTPKEIRERLERIPDDDLKLLGLNPKTVRPEWLVLTALPIPPVTVRPSIMLESGDRSEDDLTHKLVDVIRINQRLQENRDAGAPQLIVEDLWELLQYHVTTYFDNQTSGIPPARHRSGRPLKTLVQRLKGKEGRFRSNLSGKRVNYSSRTVISPDPYLSINEVGIPLETAMELTVPVTVHEYNLETARQWVARGPKNYPGVNYVIRPDGHRIRVTEKNALELANRLQPWYIIERHLIDGDIVLFNRQPSLHRMSMMAHEVRVMPYKTFRLNLCVCPPYNADFDGDEMNLHALQTDEARAEAKVLMRPQEHILSPRFCGAVIGLIHDHITGLFLLTHKTTKFDRETTVKMLSYIGYEGKLDKPAIQKGNVEYWTGKQIFSLVLPPDLNMEFKASICANCKKCKETDCQLDAYVKIVNGKLITGTIDENAVGAFKGKIGDMIVRKYGADKCKEFIDKVTKLAIGAITLFGFTVGIKDNDIPPEAGQQIQKLLKDAISKVDELVDDYLNDRLERLPGRSLEETLEVRTMQVLAKARDSAGITASKYLGLENSAVIMARSGARGSILNLSQMSGSIGQQAVRGERLSRGYHNRTLPHFKKHDLGAEARGFVKSSYKSGLTPTEFFFHSMGGREGLVDTAVRTSRSGYMQRRLINALEDLKVAEDGTVRNTAGTIIQFQYGEDGVDPCRSYRGVTLDVANAIREVLGYDIKLAAVEELEHYGYGEREFEEIEVEEQPEAEGMIAEEEFFGGEE